MGVRDASSHGMTDRRFELTEAPFAVLWERSRGGDSPKPFRKEVNRNMLGQERVPPTLNS